MRLLTAALAVAVTRFFDQGVSAIVSGFQAERRVPSPRGPAEGTGQGDPQEDLELVQR
jgi:hypothetical protein